MAKLDSLEPLLIDDLKDLLDAERQLTRALPKMAKAAWSDELRAAIEEHLEVTKNQVERLNQIFDQLDVPARPKKCAGMRGLIEEAQEKMQEDAAASVADAALIGSAQKVEHYEIAAYGTARTYADRLGHDEIARLLEQTLEEEKETDKKLTQLAESMVNPEAEQGTDEEVERGTRTRGTRGRTGGGRGQARKSGASSRTRSRTRSGRR